MAEIEEIEEGDQQKIKKPMSEEERLALAEKLDKELDEFIDGLEKRGYTEGWPEDRWEEEMDKHPFFMKTPPKEGDEMHPLLEGIQQLKYDPMENTLEDLAATYKNDGNFDMKNKKYRMAIFSYTEGIRQKCSNSELNASLYNNRSAANFFLKNYRTSLFDAKKAAQLKPGYEKAELRIVQCSYYLKQYEECINYCKTFLDKYGQNEKVLDIRTKARQAHLEKLRDERRKQNEQRRKGETLRRTIDEIKKRGIKFEEQLKTSKIENLIKPSLLPLEDYPIEMNDNGHLRWPAVFCYPEFVICDFQQQLEDTTVIYDILCDLFAEPVEQDRGHRYQPDSVNVYYENRLAGTLHKVDVNKTIKEITSENNFYVGQGVLTFNVVLKNSDAEKEFVDQKRTPLILPP